MCTVLWTILATQILKGFQSHPQRKCLGLTIFKLVSHLTKTIPGFDKWSYMPEGGVGLFVFFFLVGGRGWRIKTWMEKSKGWRGGGPGVGGTCRYIINKDIKNNSLKYLWGRGVGRVSENFWKGISNMAKSPEKYLKKYYLSTLNPRNI